LPKPVALKQTGNIPQPLVQSTKPATNRTLVTSYDLSNQQLIKNERVTGGSKDVFVQKRIPAALFALFLFGPMGSHKFFLGQTTAGAIMAIMSTVGIAGACFVFPLALIVITSSIAIAEAIIYLSKSEDQFYIDYCINKKQWF